MTISPLRHIRSSARAALVVTSVLLAALAYATPALAEARLVPHWTLESRAAPTNLPLEGEALIIVTAANTGDAVAPGDAAQPIKITDLLPPGVEAIRIQEAVSKGTPLAQAHGTGQCSAPQTKPLVCEFDNNDNLQPYEQVEVLIVVKTHLTSTSKPENSVRVEDGSEEAGGAKPAELNPARRLFSVATETNEPAHFGVEAFEMVPENENFEPDTEAGSHPFQMTTTFNLNTGLGSVPHTVQKLAPTAPALERNLSFKLPPGLIGNANVVGNPNAVKQCPDGSFGVLEEGGANFCEENTAVGVAAVTFNDPIGLGYHTYVVPVFNLVPAPGEPARFGFVVNKVPIILETSVRTGENYGVTVSVHNASQAVQVLSSRVTFWGVPREESHDGARGWACLGEGSYLTKSTHPPACEHPGLAQPTPFLMLPTACGPVETTVSGEAWNEETFAGVSYASPALEGCKALPFSPSIAVIPDTQAASTPTGLSVNVKVPQEEATLNPAAREEADIEKTRLELPEGLQANPGAAGGLLTCSDSKIGFNGLETGLNKQLELEKKFKLKEHLELEGQLENENFTDAAAICPESAKIGTVNINTPLLEHELTGAVYLAEQDTNPFKSPLVLYIVAEEPKSGVLVKLAGETSINPATGQLTSVFEHTPQTPFAELNLRLFDTARATQTTPAKCGSYAAHAEFSTWSSQEAKADEAKPPFPAESTFPIASGANGSSCPGSSLPFEPSIVAGSTNRQAGAYTPFTLKIRRPDGDAALKTISIALPPGLAAKIASVTPCPEPQAQEGTCGSESLIGESIARSGLGSSPYDLPGKVYLTGEYKGAPFGLSAVTEADAGPFQVGKVVVRSSIEINPNTAAATINTEAAQFYAQEEPWYGKEGEEKKFASTPETFGGLPDMLKGVPSQIKELEVIVNRPEFEFNPTSCESKTVKSTLTGYEGQSDSPESQFPIENCGALPFAPKLTASAGAQGSKEDGTEFKVTLESPGIGQANIHKVDLTIPALLPSRLSTIQKACLAATFEANPAACDEGSDIGEGIVTTPVFKNPLRGPAYLVSHGAAEFPDVEFVLQGEGVKIILDGKTDIKNKVTYSKFETSPDAPFTKFESIFPASPHSALTTNVPEDEHYNLCKHTLTIPTEITAYNGAQITQTTPVALIGCGEVKGVRVYKAAIKRHSVKGSTLTLVVKVPIAGRIFVTAPGLHTLKRSFSKAGTYKLTLHLGPKGQSAVVRKHRLRTRVDVRLAPNHGKGATTGVTVTFH